MSRFQVFRLQSVVETLPIMLELCTKSIIDAGLISKTIYDFFGPGMYPNDKNTEILYFRFTHLVLN